MFALLQEWWPVRNGCTVWIFVRPEWNGLWQDVFVNLWVDSLGSDKQTVHNISGGKISIAANN